MVERRTPSSDLAVQEGFSRWRKFIQLHRVTLEESPWDRLSKIQVDLFKDTRVKKRRRVLQKTLKK
jgi:hypothetical protein